MARPLRNFRPGEELLESRSLMSAGLSQPAAMVSSFYSSSRARFSSALSGSFLSTAEDNRPADGTLPVALNATGNVRGLGRVTLTGTLDFGGFRLADAPDITGTLTLTNARGSITLQFTGKGGQGALENRAFEMDASIIRGTGQFTNLRGIGTASVRFGPNTISCVTTPCPIGGKLAVGLNLRSPIR